MFDQGLRYAGVMNQIDNPAQWWGAFDLVSNGCPRFRSALIFDDDTEIGLLCCQMLAFLGVLGQHFTAPAGFMAALRARPPDLVVLELALGPTDAVDVIRELSAISYDGAVLLFSGREQDLLESIYRIGLKRGLAMLPPLRKPFRLDDLRQCLSQEPSRQREQSSTPSDAIFVNLKDILDHDWLEVWYQPKFDVATLAICGAEALARARHPEFGVLAPAQFLPPGDSSLHRDLLAFVFERAISDGAALPPGHPPLKLSINAPASALACVVPLVRRLVPHRPNFPGLIVEVTEDEVIRDPTFANEIAAQLSLHKVELSIDDFGAGFSSLSRLTHLQFRELKLDQSFVQGSSQDPRKLAICQGVVELGHSHNISVCAEGVENLADFALVKKLGFDTAQGYLFGRAQPLSKLTELLMPGPRSVDLIHGARNTAVAVARSA